MIGKNNYPNPFGDVLDLGDEPTIVRMYGETVEFASKRDAARTLANHLADNAAPGGLLTVAFVDDDGKDRYLGVTPDVIAAGIVMQSRFRYFADLGAKPLPGYIDLTDGEGA